MAVPRKNRQVTVIHKGSNFSSNPLISLQERTIFIKIDIEKTRSEILVSSIDIPVKKWVHIVFTYKELEVIEGCLFINGNLDSEISVSKSKDKEKSNIPQKIYIGKDPWNHGLIGSIAEPVYYFTSIESDLISKLYSSGIENWQNQQNFGTTKFFYVPRKT